MKKEEFDILSYKIRPKLISLARNFISVVRGIEAEDIVQESLLTLWELSEQGYPIKDSESLAIKITKNICIKHYRKNHLDTHSLIQDNYIGDIEATYLTDLDDLKIIKKHIYSKLTNTQKEYLYLRNEEGKSLDEIADITGKPKTSIKSTISSARKQMLDLIKNQL